MKDIGAASRLPREVSMCFGQKVVPDLSQCGLYVGPEADLLNVVPDYASLSSFGTWERGRGLEEQKAH
ncbi:hypothetical protein EMCRGX_G010900 [Ephydatia muelleri]